MNKFYIIEGVCPCVEVRVVRKPEPKKIKWVTLKRKEEPKVDTITVVNTYKILY